MTVCTYRFTAHYDAGDADEGMSSSTLEVAGSLSFTLSLFFIRLFQTLNMSLYNSSQPLQLPGVSGSSLGGKTATYKGRSAPQPTI